MELNVCSWRWQIVDVIGCDLPDKDETYNMYYTYKCK